MKSPGIKKNNRVHYVIRSPRKYHNFLKPKLSKYSLTMNTPHSIQKRKTISSRSTSGWKIKINQKGRSLGTPRPIVTNMIIKRCLNHGILLFLRLTADY